MLDSFLAEKAEEQRLFRVLEERGELDHSIPDGKSGISVDEFRIAFAEDWQLSQFWYVVNP
jgi:hypothetical protein